jgi:hypothetical protein
MISRQKYTVGNRMVVYYTVISRLSENKNDKNDATPVVRERILKGNRCRYGLHNIFRSQDIAH